MTYLLYEANVLFGLLEVNALFITKFQDPFTGLLNQLKSNLCCPLVMCSLLTKL